VSKIILGAIFILIGAFLFYVSLDANKYAMQVRVIEGQGKIGLNPTTERLDFGDLSPGASATRLVTIENATGIPMYVFSMRLGGITDLVDQDKNFFVLAPHEKASIEFEAYMPASAPIGETITGKVFLFKIPGPWK
jgi:hypothetical protein